MILQNIDLENFGVFRGKHAFNLTPDLQGKRPIILFGGLNGSGKTTLFEGIKLCLYGRLTLKELRTKRAYNSYLKKKIEPLNPQRGRKYFGAIELHIEFNDFGVKDIYSVRRTWNVERENVEEKFRVLKNGQMLGTIEQEYSQAFIANLIPMGVSNHFFFDGEKIQQLAEDTQNNGYFKEALDSILGLDVIQTLVKDLQTYSYKQIGADDRADVVHEIERLSKNRVTLDDELANIHQDRSSVRTKLD
ncbi:AAA family ATPase, partial [bacterium]|nr:AAA family ATPase [bacterium]